MYHILIYKGGVKDVEIMHEGIVECSMRPDDGSLDITFEARNRPGTWESMNEEADIKAKRVLWINREGRTVDELLRLMPHFGMLMVGG